MTDPICSPVTSAVARVFLQHMESFGDVKPRAVILAPYVYRLWRNAPERRAMDCTHGEGTYFGVPIKCKENLKPDGTVIMTVQ